MNGESKNIVKCDFCNAGALVNFQKVWTKFTINKEGEYKEDKRFCGGDFEEPTEEDNIHLCEEHSEKWLRGEI